MLLKLEFVKRFHSFLPSTFHILHSSYSHRTMPSIIVGIGGVTNGGKTTICQHLLNTLQGENVAVTHYNMDDYYWEEDSSNHVMLEKFNYANWDDVCSVDWDRLLTDVKTWKTNTTENQTRLLLIEGIMIYNHSSLLTYFDKKYFFTLPKEECWKRRSARVYLPPEPPGYFDEIAWPFYLKFRDKVASQPDIVYIDGRENLEQVFKKVLAEVQTFLSHDKCS